MRTRSFFNVFEKVHIFRGIILELYSHVDQIINIKKAKSLVDLGCSSGTCSEILKEQRLSF